MDKTNEILKIVNVGRWCALGAGEMTTVQRAKVADLLRCAAALEFYEEGAHGSFLHSAAIKLAAPWEIEELARRACCYVSGDGTSRSIQLSAAARVESRSWP